PGVDTMTSSSGQGNTNVTLQFRLDRNIDLASQDVQAAISSVQRRLPRAMPNPPTFRKQDPSAQPIFQIALWSDTIPIDKVDALARNMLVTQLSTLDGVAQVQIMGAARYAVRIQADPAALAARQMSLVDLSNAANINNVNAASGTLNGETRVAAIHTDG